MPTAVDLGPPTVPRSVIRYSCCEKAHPGTNARTAPRASDDGECDAIASSSCSSLSGAVEIACGWKVLLQCAVFSSSRPPRLCIRPPDDVVHQSGRRLYGVIVIDLDRVVVTACGMENL